MENLEQIRAELAKAKEEKMQYEHQVTRLENRVKDEVKKKEAARTHRLIQEGAELECAFDGIALLNFDEYRKFIWKLSKLPGVMELYESFKEGGDD